MKKEAYEREEKRQKEENENKKKREMNFMKNTAIRASNAKKATFGAISTFMFIQFACQHVFLALK